jgi:hypothetical protein
MGGSGLNLDNRLRAIEANLDDLQAGVEACSRAANKIDAETVKSNGLLKTSLHRSLLDHVKDLLICVRDQRVVVQELRRSLVELRHEETARQAVHPPLNVRAAASRSR